MARAIWSGAISFGLVSIPVKLYPAVSHKSVRFKQLDGRTNSRVKQKRVSAVDGEEVPYDEIVKGYEVMKDQYVVITDEDLASLSPKSSRMIDITDFVLQEDIDPVFYESAYFLVPDELARKSYALLAEALEESGKVAMANLVMRTKQHLAAIRPVDGHLMLSTMIYHDEAIAVADVPGLEELEGIEVTDAERAMANQLIESLTSDFVATNYVDTYRVELLALIERKSAGELTTIEAAATEESEGVVDLLAALEASVSAAKKARSRHPTGSDPVDSNVTEADDGVLAPVTDIADKKSA